MARFKRFKARARSVGRRMYGKVRRSVKTGSKPEDFLLPAALYGAARGPVVNLISPLTSKMPLGGYEDEVVLGLASYFAAKKGTGFVKKLGYAGLCVEAASAASGLTAGFTGSASKGSNSIVYG